MSSKFDWSKFEEAPSSDSKFDWGKYEEIEPSKIRNWSKEGSNKKPLNEFFDFTEVNKQKKEAKEQHRLIAEHPFKSAASAGIGIGRGANAPIDLAEMVLKKTGLIDENAPTGWTNQLLDKASEFVQQNVSPEDQERLSKFEKAAAWIPPTAVAKPLVKGTKSLLNKIPQQAENLAPRTFKKVTDTFESGLTKPRAVEARYADKAIITPQMQAKTIASLEKEAANLTRKSVEKHVPITKEIEGGFNFGKKFESEFGELNHLAKKHNLDIDTKPLNSFLREAKSKYRDLPNPHPEAKSILAEVKGWAKKPISDLSNLVKIVRSNNKKIGKIFETSRTNGTQKEYVDFLLDTNRKIEESIVKYLPEDSYWVKQFQGLNKRFSEFKKGQETLAKLEPVLGEKIDTSVLRKLAIDPKRQKKLALSMGQEGANEIIQISKDLKTAIDSIKKMSAREIAYYEAAYPISYLIPGVGHATGAASVLYKGSKIARRLYGAWLTKPSTRKVYDEALNALAKKDFPAYVEATNALKKADY